MKQIVLLKLISIRTGQARLTSTGTNYGNHGKRPFNDKDMQAVL
jgi:hypothetical protein